VSTVPGRRARSWHESGSRALPLTAVLVAMTALLGGCTGGSSNGAASPASPPGADAGGSSAADFLRDYVREDGAVVRRDQGGDVVSEGQAYGMLIAQAAGHDDVVDTIWSWTRSHLLSADGLLAFHADPDGKVLDPQSAADADTLAAYALLRATGPDAAELHHDGRRLATAVLDQETLRDERGGWVLAAGPWAVGPRVVNPSYWMPGVFGDLARLTGDPRWTDLAATSVDLLEKLTDSGRTLPPDWGRLDGDSVVPAGQGGGSGTPQYGPDAQRVPLWLAASCDRRARDLAGAWWSLLQQDDRSAALSLSTTGQSVDATPSVVALLASAASAEAAGDTAGAARLRTGAAQADRRHPTYYGAAWLALADQLRRRC
jgi:endoglucanase